MTKNVELFSIVCDSCTAKLKVRQKSVIGQILACPKCGSMVKVEAPEGWTPPDTSDSQNNHSVPDAKDSFDEIDALLAGKVVTQTTTIKRPAAGKTAGATHPNRTARPLPKQTAAAPATSPSSAPVLPNEQWTNEQAKQKQKWLLLIFGLLAILVTASILAFALISNLFDDPQIADANPDETSSANTNTLENQPGENETDNSTTDDASNPESGEIEDDAGSSSSDPNGTDSEGGTDDEPANAEVNNSGETDENSATDIIIVDGNDSSPSIDDLANQPRGIDDAASERPKSILEELSIIGELENNAGGTALDQMYADQREETIGRSRIYIAKPDPFEIKLEKQTQEMIIHGIRTELTLRELADKIYQLSRVALTVDPDALLARQIDPQQTFKIDVTQKTVSDIANEQFNPLGFVFVPTGNGARVVVEGFSEFAQVQYDIPQVETFSEEELQGLVASIQRTIYPASWTASGGEGSVEVVAKKLICRAQPHVHFQIEKLMAKLAAAQAIQSGNPTEDDLKITKSLYEHRKTFDQIALDGHRVSPVRLELIASQIEKEHGITLLMDWQNIESAGWNPDVLIPWNPEGRSLSEMLRDICHAMNLEWRIVNEKLIVLTTRDIFTQHMDIEVYPLSSYPDIKLTVDQLIPTLQSQLGSLVARIPTASVSYQDKFGCIIAVLPQDIQFQLAATLNRLNGTK